MPRVYARPLVTKLNTGMHQAPDQRVALCDLQCRFRVSIGRYCEPAPDAANFAFAGDAWERRIQGS